MADSERLQQVLGEFGATVGLEDLRLDEAGHCVLAIDDTLVVNLELDAAKGSAVLYSWLGVPTGDLPEIYGQLLQANYLGQGTGGATLGLQAETGGIVLSQSVALEHLDLPRFNTALETFVNQAERWSERLAQPAPEAAAAADEPPATEPSAPDHIIRV
jgi:hypothetical protein